MSRQVSDVLANITAVNQRIGPLLLKLLNEPDTQAQAAKLRQLSQHLGTLSAECLARAADIDG